VSAIRPFTLDIPETELDALRTRLALTRWPAGETVADSSQGVRLDQLQPLVEHWRDGYDWRRVERELNGIGQVTTEIDGVQLHVLHAVSPEPDALPLLMTHGWPGSVLEFRKVLGPLTDPVAFGGDARDAFHVIAPSMPGLSPRTPSSSRAARRPSATRWPIRRWGWPHGSTRSSRTAAAPLRMPGRASRPTSCSTTSCSTGCPAPA
jgi:microsomal epoxide hydrolase